MRNLPVMLALLCVSLGLSTCGAYAADAAPGAPPAPSAPPAPAASPPKGDFSFRGNPDFDPEQLDDAVEDRNRLSVREYHAKLLRNMARGAWDGSFDKPEFRSANREGNMHVTDLLTSGLRVLGDLRFLDEALRLLDLKKAHFSLDSEGRRYWKDDVYGTDLDSSLMVGLIARVAYAAHVNRDLPSPGGWDYGAEADYWKTWLFEDFVPRWMVLDHRTELPFIAHTGGTNNLELISAHYYMGKLGGGAGFTADQYIETARELLDFRLSHDAVCNDGEGGRPVRVWKHTIGGTSPNGGVLQYTTYVRFEISVLMDLFLEGFDERINDEYLSQIANSLADLVIDFKPLNITDLLARTIGGDNPPGGARCSVPYNHTYRARMSDAMSRWQFSSFAFLEGFDTLGKIERTGFTFYFGATGTFKNSYVSYLAARIFTYFYHGWR